MSGALLRRQRQSQVPGCARPEAVCFILHCVEIDFDVPEFDECWRPVGDGFPDNEFQRAIVKSWKDRPGFATKTRFEIHNLCVVRGNDRAEPA